MTRWLYGMGVKSLFKKVEGVLFITLTALDVEVSIVKVGRFWSTFSLPLLPDPLFAQSAGGVEYPDCTSVEG